MRASSQHEGDRDGRPRGADSHTQGNERRVPAPPLSTPGNSARRDDRPVVHMPMGGRDAPSADAMTRARRVLAELFGPVAGRHFAVRFWDGTVDAPPRVGEIPFTMVLASPGSLRRMFLPPSELRLAESFLRGDFDVEGDLERAAELADHIRTRLASPGAVARLALRLLALPGESALTVAERRDMGSAARAAAHSRDRDRAAIRSHYDVGNEFYRLWLDRDMVYSCAYFENGHEDIDAAQQAKLELLCRKLRLAPGDRLLDIGCGWGGLVRYAAEHYGVSALGVTLSPAQAVLANERIADAGLATRCAVEVRDYRDLEPQQFDKIVSVGMFEHVGPTQLATYFTTVYGLLKPRGLFLNHGIVAAPRESAGIRARLRHALWREDAFMLRYVFPDGELVTLSTAIGEAERAGFETRDVESLREHYVLTARHWVARLQAHESDAVQQAGAQTYRTWRLYLAAATRALRIGSIGLAQMLLAKPGEDGRVALPLTRADLYR